jgi:hypothetical protein
MHVLCLHEIKIFHLVWFQLLELLHTPFHLLLVRWNSIRELHHQNCHFISCIEAYSLRVETTIKFYREVVESSYRDASESTSWLQQELLVLLFPVAQHCQDIRVIQWDHGRYSRTLLTYLDNIPSTSPRRFWITHHI